MYEKLQKFTKASRASRLAGIWAANRIRESDWDPFTKVFLNMVKIIFSAKGTNISAIYASNNTKYALLAIPFLLDYTFLWQNIQPHTTVNFQPARIARAFLAWIFCCVQKSAKATCIYLLVYINININIFAIRDHS